MKNSIDFDLMLDNNIRKSHSNPWVGVPKKTREIHNHHFDSTIWNDFEFRHDDIIISTYAKSGTTWTQQIVGQLLFGPNPNLPVADMSPWLDLRIPSKAEKFAQLENQFHRRFIKTHLPLDALVFSLKAKYIYVGRDARDVVWSLHNHHLNANDLWYQLLNNTPGLVGSPICPPNSQVVDYWVEWLENDGFPFWSFWDNVRSWWAARNYTNVLMVHYADLLNDMEGEMLRIARFLNIRIEPSGAKWRKILEYCSFDWMKAHGELALPLKGAFWDNGAKTFVNKGINGRWRSMLTSDHIREYQRRAITELGAECFDWLSSGSAKSQTKCSLWSSGY